MRILVTLPLTLFGIVIAAVALAQPTMIDPADRKPGIVKILQGTTQCREPSKNDASCASEYWSMYVHDDVSRYMHVVSDNIRAGEVRHAMLWVDPDRATRGAYMNSWSRSGVLGSAFVMKKGETATVVSAEIAEEPRAIKDCELCPNLVVLPPGTFTFGAEQSEGKRWGMLDRMSANEGPQVEITIGRSFAIGQTEVTQSQFAAFVKDTGYKVKFGCFHLTSAGWSVQPKLNWEDPGFEVTDNHPVACVRRPDALAYIDWLSEVTGQAYRLPSEAEFEYAARGGATSETQATYWGENWDDACTYQNGADLAFVPNVPDIPYGQYAECDDGYVFTAPVGSFEPNAWGLFDMAGNVSEWTEDCYQDSHDNVPTDGTPFNKRQCRAWVAKGGSWAGFPGLLRPATRLRILATTVGTGFGFRVARSLSE